MGCMVLMTLPSVRPSQMASYVEVTPKIIGDGSHGALIIHGRTFAVAATMIYTASVFKEVEHSAGAMSFPANDPGASLQAYK